MEASDRTGMDPSEQRIVELLRDARQQLALERRRRASPIAIVGIGCRFPGGASTPSAFWDLLVRGVDATCEVPADRWDAQAFYDPDPDVPGKAYTTRGAFLDQIAAFDPKFFGISPREALGMDPQQRLLLEVTWEAIEDAGIPVRRLRGTATGVWIGMCAHDHARRGLWTGNPEDVDAYNALGSSNSVAAGRISYVLDLRGPNVQIDTACSSSLVAVHQATASLRWGECDIALVGGVNLMSAPEMTIALCKLRALARDGRCKTFDASADGYGRGEGCGMVVLKRLEDAVSAGDRIYATIRGTAVNHGGQGNGLTAPNRLSQEAVMRAALANAQIAPKDVGYVETHGTGTLLGDPIEILASSRVYGHDRSPDQPLKIGALKTQIGHLEGAAGIAGLIKVALCLSHAELTPLLHLRAPNPTVPWAELPVRLVTESSPWPLEGNTRLAGVSSFGISGTNAHAVLEQWPASAEQRPSPLRSAELVVLSARSTPALRAASVRLLEHVESHSDLALGDIAYSLLATRSPMERRLALVVPNRQALIDGLHASTRHDALANGALPLEEDPRVVFVFSGQGSQWFGMGRQLLAEEPEFLAAMQACDRAIRRETGWSVMAELDATDVSRQGGIDVIQPVLFSMQVALAALWRSWGVEPDALVGHSMGEVAAAVVSGALSLEDGAAVTCRRSRLLRRIRGRGEMALVELSLEQAGAAIAGREGKLGVAATNGPRSSVLSGEPEALAQVLSELEQRAVFCRRVKVDVASHSPQVDSLLDELLVALADLTPRPAQVPMRSTVTGADLLGGELTASYWAANLRQPVRFDRSIETLLGDDFSIFVEVSPHPLLAAAMDELRRARGTRGVVVGSLRREQPERLTLLESLGAMHVHGLTLKPEALFSTPGNRVPLPTYPWQRERYWTKLPVGSKSLQGPALHPLLGRRTATGMAMLYESAWSLAEHPWLADHRVRGRVVVPAAALLQTLSAAAADYHRGGPVSLKDVVFEAPLVFSEELDPVHLQVALTKSGTQAELHARASSSAEVQWTRHASARIISRPTDRAESIDLDAARQRARTTLHPDEAYLRLSLAGLEHTGNFRSLRSLQSSGSELVAGVEPGELSGAQLHGVLPAILDCAFQALVGFSIAGPPRTLLPFEVGEFSLHHPNATSAAVHAHLIGEAPDAITADLVLADTTGRVFAEIKRLTCRLSHGIVSHPPALRDAYTLHFRAWTGSCESRPLRGGWLVISIGRDADAAELRRSLEARGASCQQVTLADLQTCSPADHVVCYWDAADGSSEAALELARGALAILQWLTRAGRSSKLWWLTQHAVAVNADEDVLPSSAALWGLGRTVMLEHPELHCTLLDTDGSLDSADIVARELVIADDESQVAWRAGARRSIARLEPVRSSTTSSPAEVTSRVQGHTNPRELRLDGTILISGGLGAIGGEVATELARRGAAHLLLLGRHGLSGRGAARAVAALEELGSRVTVAAIDVTDARAVGGVLRSVPDRYPLRAVVHAAGILDDALISDQTALRFQAVMAPKVQGAWNLHVLTRDLNLDWFVLISSMSGLMGSAGQSAYAAANAFLDGLAMHRAFRGLAAHSLAWGPWSGRGLFATHEGGARENVSRMGIAAFTAEAGIALFSAAMRRPEPALMLARIDWVALAKASASSGVPPVWQERLDQPVHPDQEPGSLRGGLLALSGARQSELALQLVTKEIAAALTLNAGFVVPDRRLSELGLDSLMALQIRNSLARAIGVTLPASLLVDGRGTTARRVAERLLTALSLDARVTPTLLHVDARLEDDVRALPAPPRSDPECVLLTGATGFLGAFLLVELCQQTAAEIVCLVRAPTVGEGRRRVVDNLREHGLWDESIAHRFSVITGDLGSPRLGLSEGAFQQLAARLDAVYSNGAYVSFVAGYEELKPSHVNGTREILRLATTGRSKVIHHVSSTSAYSSPGFRDQRLDESSPPIACEDMILPYAQCKWVTECMVRAAADRGIPVVIYRPSGISGSSLTGAWSAADFMLRTLRGMADLECLPGPLDIHLDFAPVDYVARGIVHLARQTSSIGKAFHLNHPVGSSWSSLLEIMRSLGYPVELIAYDDWTRRIEETRHAGLYPLLPFLCARGQDQLSYLERLQRPFCATIACDMTADVLRKAGIECPPIGAELIARYLRHLVSTGAAGTP
jgi:thioester reductase-like protein